MNASTSARTQACMIHPDPSAPLQAPQLMVEGKVAYDGPKNDM